MSSHPFPTNSFRQVSTATERRDRPNPGELVCVPFGDWGFIAADAWLMQTGYQDHPHSWRATVSTEMATWWDGSDERPATTEQWARPIADVPDDGGALDWCSVSTEADAEAVLWNTLLVMEHRAGIVRKAPEKVARYYVVIERDLHEGDHSQAYVGDKHVGTDGTYESCVKQLAAELQDGWDAAGIAGFFRIVGREVTTWMEAGVTPALPVGEWPRQDNPA